MAQPRPPPLARERGSAQDCSQQEVVSTAHESGEAKTPVPAVPQPQPSRTPVSQGVVGTEGVAAAFLGGRRWASRRWEG